MSATTRPHNPPAVPPLPAYSLYGEPAGRHATEPLHVETISSRSRLHDWEIQPHRHEALFQILHIQHGQAQAGVDGQHWPLIGPCVVTVPALTAHGFVFQPGVAGHVITVRERHAHSLCAAEPGLWEVLAQPSWLSPPRHGSTACQLEAAVQALADEYAQQRPWRATALDAALQQLLLAVARALPARQMQEGGAGDRALAHLARYRALVEARFRLQPRVADLAAELGMTPTQLNRICQAVAGQSALALLHGRMALEAQRQLSYTRQSIKQIGLELGFADPGYFSRFFQRLCGCSPSTWRQRA